MNRTVFIRENGQWSAARTHREELMVCVSTLVGNFFFFGKGWMSREARELLDVLVNAHPKAWNMANDSVEEFRL